MLVQPQGPLWVRRGDLFTPFDEPINGDKVRQTLHLLMKNRTKILDQCDGIVATSCGARANQGVIVSYVAKALGLQPLVAVGGDSREKMIARHGLLRKCDSFGCQIEVVSKAGYPNVVHGRMIEKFPNAFVVKFGMNMESHPDAVLDPTAKQVQALPNDIDNLVIPVGSGVTVAGILRGLIEYEIHPRRVILVQIAGKDRSQSINEMVGETYPYELIRFDRYPYARWIDRKIDLDPSQTPIGLDGMNEAKAYEWLMESIDIKNEKTVFWIVANSAEIRGIRQ